MTFANIPNGSQVFIDAKTLVDHATADANYGAACKQLMERIARREIEGLTSAHALGDVAHRVMTLEAIAQFGWSAKGIGNRLRRHPADVQRLTRFRQAVVWQSSCSIPGQPFRTVVPKQCCYRWSRLRHDRKGSG